MIATIALNWWHIAINRPHTQKLNSILNGTNLMNRRVSRFDEWHFVVCIEWVWKKNRSVINTRVNVWLQMRLFVWFIQFLGWNSFQNKQARRKYQISIYLNFNSSKNTNYLNNTNKSTWSNRTPANIAIRLK